MVSPTIHYKKLLSSLKEAKRILSHVPNTYCDSTYHHLKVQSYVFLSHAAIEEYIEDIALYVLAESILKYKNNEHINKCLLSLIVFETVYQFDENTPRKSLKLEVVENFSTFVHIAKKSHETEVGNNNGIKIENQKKLLLPIGVDLERVDLNLANSLDAFGAARGGIAHKFKTKTKETKSSVLASTKQISKDLRQLDEEAESVIAS